MRSINTLALSCPGGWEARAAAAKAQAGNDVGKISRQSAVWRELKDTLAELSHDKCWYCEVKQERSDNAVDHFRPKSRYPWLAFEKGNLRYSCTYCNSPRKNPDTGETEGKSDDFPLLDETRRATSPGQESSESPMLLDPCQVQDPGLLDFRDDGIPCAKFPDHSVRKQRSEVSIKAYHLDHPDLVEKRKVLAADLRAKIKQADDLFEQCEQGNPAIDKAFCGLIEVIHRAISEASELSVFARKIVSGERNKDWVEQLLRTA